MKKRTYGIQRVHYAMSFLYFAIRPGAKKKASSTEIGVEFNKIKLRLIQNYVNNCIEAAKVQEERGQSNSSGLGVPGGSVGNDNGNGNHETRSTNFQPQWTKPGVIRKSLIQAECERNSGVLLPQKPVASEISRAEADARESDGGGRAGNSPGARQTNATEGGRVETKMIRLPKR